MAPGASAPLKRAPHLNSPESRRGSSMACAHYLLWLPLSAIRSPPQCPLIARANRIQRIPELGGDSRVRGILDHADALAVLNLPPDFAAELEVVSLVID